MRIIKHGFVILLALTVLGCSPKTAALPTQPVNESTATPELPSTAVVPPSPSDSPTPSVVPTETSTLTPTASPTPIPTLTPTPRIPLSAENFQNWQIFQTLGGVSGIEVAFSADGKYFALARPTEIILYDTGSLRSQKNIPTSYAVTGLSISPDGNVLLAMDDQRTVHRYQLPSGELLDGPLPLQEVTDFCSQGQTLSSYVWWSAHLFCLPDQSANFFTDPTLRGLITMAFNSDATLAALGGQSGFELVSLDGDRKNETKWDTQQWIDSFGSAAAFSPDGQEVALGFTSGMVYRLNVNTGEEIAAYVIGGELQGLDYNPDGSLLAVTTATETNVVQLASGLISQVGAVSPGIVEEMVFSPDGQRLLTANRVNQFMLWNTADGSLIHQWDGKPFEIHHNYPNYACILWGGRVAYSPDGRYLALGDDGSVHIVDAYTGGTLHKLEVGKVLSLAFSPDSRQIGVGTSDFAAGGQRLADGIQIWDVASGELVQTLPGNAGISGNVSYNCNYNLAFTPDGQTLITTGQDVITLWDLATGQQVQTGFNPRLNEIRGFALASDGSLLAASGGENVIKLWTMDGDEIASQAFGIIPFDSWFVALDHTAKLLAAGSTESDRYIIKFWNTADQLPLGTIEIKIEGNTAYKTPWIAFSPTGDVLAISADGSVYFYAVQP